VAINNQDNNKGFIPCYPSPPIYAQGPILFIDDVYTDTYEASKEFLEKVYAKTKKSKPQIPCKPYMKIIEDGLIVGILTMTNQFVSIDEPTQDTFGDDLKIMQSINYAEVDTTLSSLDSSVDTERVNYIKKIQLETKFYNVFRTTARYLLGQYEHTDIRREIEEKTKSAQSYLKKLRSIETLLRDLMKNNVIFHAYAENDLLKLDTITNCYNNCENKAYCKADAGKADAGKADIDEPCKLMIPETNLISLKSNDTFYYGKLADEIVRYSRIKSFIFNPKSVLSFSQLKYNLRENEIILLQSLLTQEYFENIIAAKVNPYIKYNSYDTTQPIIAQKYSNADAFVKETEAETDLTDACAAVIKDHVASKYWNAIFPLNSKEYIYPIECSFNVILTIIRDHDSSKNAALTKNKIKEILLDEYLKLYDKYNKNIMKILSAQGKKILAGQLLKKQVSLSDMIISEEYYATDLDIWLLAMHYQIPLVFLSESSLMENHKKFIVAVADPNYYYFLKVSAPLPQLPPIYTIIRENENMQIPITHLRNPAVQAELRAVAADPLIQFIETFSLTEYNARRKTIKIGKTVAQVAVPAPLVPAPIVPAPIVPAAPLVPAEAADPLVPAPALVPAPIPKNNAVPKRIVPRTIAIANEPATPAPATPAPTPAKPVKKISKMIKIKN
jgi:hypothetical protein